VITEPDGGLLAGGSLSSPQTNLTGVSPAAAVMVNVSVEPAAGELELPVTVGGLGSLGST
jgi:hypothetical protein